MSLPMSGVSDASLPLALLTWCSAGTKTIRFVSPPNDSAKRAAGTRIVESLAVEFGAARPSPARRVRLNKDALSISPAIGVTPVAVPFWNCPDSRAVTSWTRVTAYQAR